MCMYICMYTNQQNMSHFKAFSASSNTSVSLSQHLYLKNRNRRENMFLCFMSSATLVVLVILSIL